MSLLNRQFIMRSVGYTPSRRIIGFPLLTRYFTSAGKPIITPRRTNFSLWYKDVVSAAELIDAAPIKGCMILKPNGYGIWEEIQRVCKTHDGRDIWT